MIPLTSWADQGDGTAWRVFDEIPLWDLAVHLRRLDRPCDACFGKGTFRERRRGMSGDYNCLECDGTGRHTFPVTVERAGPRGANIASLNTTTGKTTYRSKLLAAITPGMVLPIVEGDDRNGERRIILSNGEARITDKVSGPPHLIANFPSDAKAGGIAALLRWGPAPK